jgi:hypothetical protein
MDEAWFQPKSSEMSQASETLKKMFETLQIKRILHWYSDSIQPTKANEYWCRKSV